MTEPTSVMARQLGLRVQSTGQRVTQPEFCMQFDSSGAPDLAATFKQLDDAWHTSMLISHSTYQEREHRSTPKKKEGEEKSRATV